MTVWGVVRASTKKQVNSRERQRMYLIQFARDLKLPEPERWCEEQESGGDTNDIIERERFKEMDAQLVAGDIVLSEHPDRVSRNAPVLLLKVREWNRRHIKVYFGILGPLDVSDPLNEMILGNLALFSNYFLADLKRKTKIGLLLAKSRKMRSGPIPPYFEEVREDGHAILRPTEKALEIERAILKTNRNRAAKAHGMRNQQQAARLMVNLKSWRETGPWVRHTTEERVEREARRHER